MNWYMVFRIIIKLILIVILISITFFQWLKFSEENTSISVSYAAQRNLELPALTICPEYQAKICSTVVAIRQIGHCIQMF